MNIFKFLIGFFVLHCIYANADVAYKRRHYSKHAMLKYLTKAYKRQYGKKDNTLLVEMLPIPMSILMSLNNDKKVEISAPLSLERVPLISEFLEPKEKDPIVLIKSPEPKNYNFFSSKKQISEVLGQDEVQNLFNQYELDEGQINFFSLMLEIDFSHNLNIIRPTWFTDHYCIPGVSDNTYKRIGEIFMNPERNAGILMQKKLTSLYFNDINGYVSTYYGEPSSFMIPEQDRQAIREFNKSQMLEKLETFLQTHYGDKKALKHAASEFLE